MPFKGLLRADTIGQKLSTHNGITSGFDYLRLVLALGVLCIHAIAEVTTDRNAPLWLGPYRPIAASLLPMFFALSGFLVTASLARTAKLTTFLTYRAVRILPALAVEIFLSALILGPLLTTLPLAGYFTSPHFWAYFGNIIGHIHYILPGVFENNIHPNTVNRSLWTIPYEFYCYFAVALLVLFRLASKRLLLISALMAFITAATLYTIYVEPRAQHLGPPTWMLVTCFLFGCAGYQYRDKIPFSFPVMLICLLLSLIFASHGNLYYLASPTLTYVTIWLGLQNPARKTFLMRGDYSYGLYLFAYPMQQTAVLLFPAYNMWWFNIMLAAPVSLAYAILSWHMVEKPILAHKKEIAAQAQTWADRITGKGQTPA